MTRGTTILITGLPAAGKTTLANQLFDKLTLEFDLTVTLLDGDNVRQLLSSNLGYSKADREQNLARIRFVAREVTRHGGKTICAVIAPYAESRRQFRKEIEACGEYTEVYSPHRWRFANRGTRREIISKPGQEKLQTLQEWGLPMKLLRMRILLSI